MIALPQGLAARVQAKVTSLALCWRVVRTDGIALGFTGHDRGLMIDGLWHHAAPGMLSSAVALSDGLEADTMEVSGALSSGGIDAVDLAAGRFDGASLNLFLVDWEQPMLGTLPLARGLLGAVERRDGRFTAELRGAAAGLERAALELTSPECRAELGDKRCRVALGPRTRATVVVAVDTQTAITVAAVASGINAYGYGRMRVLSGAAAGLEAALLSSASAVLTLREPLRMPIAVGDRVVIREGCDKRLASCMARFGNVLNFRGEPHVPGTDVLTRYPGG